MFGTILVNAPIQSVIAGHSPTEDKRSFDHRRERVSKPPVCRVHPCEHPIPLALPQPEMSGNEPEPNEPIHFISVFHTTLESLKKEAVSLPKITMDSFLEAVENPQTGLHRFGNPPRRAFFKPFGK